MIVFFTEEGIIGNKIKEGEPEFPLFKK